jgi:hypothetical protein
MIANRDQCGCFARHAIAGLGFLFVVTDRAAEWVNAPGYRMLAAVQVLATPEPPTHVRVQWPGGTVTRVPVPEGSREVTVQFSDSHSAERGSA